MREERRVIRFFSKESKAKNKKSRDRKIRIERDIDLEGKRERPPDGESA